MNLNVDREIEFFYRNTNDCVIYCTTSMYKIYQLIVIMILMICIIVEIKCSLKQKISLNTVFII